MLIEAHDVADIARGAAILGAGGGGDPYLGRLLAENAIERHGPVTLVRLADVPDDALVVPVGIMGAPTVIVEKPPSGHEFGHALAGIESALGRPVTHIACLEAGGLNSMTPLITAATAGLPLIDADGMGRAFPELQMILPTLDGIPASPMAMVDEKGNRVVLETVDNPWAERLARSATVDMGCSACIALYPMTGAQARGGLVPETLTLAGRLGRLVTRCRAEHRDAAAAIAEEMGGRVLFTGKVVDVARRTEGGFAKGTARLVGFGATRTGRKTTDQRALDEPRRRVRRGHGSDDGTDMLLSFQNEHLVAELDGRVLASVPDLVAVLDADTGEPVTTEAMRYGFRVVVLGLPCHHRWRTPEGLALVGPGYFGYDHEYVPIAPHGKG